jgi:hypothetical protein
VSPKTVQSLYDCVGKDRHQTSIGLATQMIYPDFSYGLN